MTTTIQIQLSPGDASRLEEVTQSVNRPRLRDGEDPLTEAEVAAYYLHGALLEAYRGITEALVGT